VRYNPSTDQAVSIDQIAAECRVAITSYQIKPRDVFAAESCRIWAMCRKCAGDREDQSNFARLDAMLADDMYQAMHHRPHQAEI